MAKQIRNSRGNDFETLRPRRVMAMTPDVPASSDPTPVAQNLVAIEPLGNVNALAEQIAELMREPLVQGIANRIVRELRGETQTIAAVASLIAGIQANLIPHYVSTNTMPASTNATADQDGMLRGLRERIQDIVSVVGDYQPVTAGFVGRALHELGAHNAETGKNRPDIFAFFASGESTGVLQSHEDYEVAQGCVRQHGQPSGRAASGSAQPVSNSRTTSGNRASDALTRPIEALERWRLIDHSRDARDRRQAAYLIDDVARLVFTDWPEWPTPRSQTSTSTNQ